MKLHFEPITEKKSWMGMNYTTQHDYVVTAPHMRVLIRKWDGETRLLGADKPDYYTAHFNGVGMVDHFATVKEAVEAVCRHIGRYITGSPVEFTITTKGRS